MDGRSVLAPLPLYPGASPCVGSGFCCKQAPCPFGDVTSPTNRACKHLVQIETPGHPRYTCGIYEQIVGKPGWELAPAFGSGCCSNLFNEDRDAIIAEIKASGDIAAEVRRHHHEN